MIPTTLAERVRFHRQIVTMITAGALVVVVVVVALLMICIRGARYEASRKRPDVKEVLLLNIGGLDGLKEGAMCLVSLDAPLEEHPASLRDAFAVHRYTPLGGWYGQCPPGALVRIDKSAIAQRARLRELSGRQGGMRE